MDSWERVVMHLDMDAFYASVERLDDPSLEGKPVIVGRNMRGVVTAASYEARVFGVHSAMPVATAKRLCPHGVYLPVRMSRYAEVSRRVMAALKAMVPVMEQTSVDEAYLDMTGTEGLLGPPADAAGRLKAAIREATGLTASVGVAPNKFLAKIASDMDKPDGLFVIAPGGEASFLASLPVAKVPGVGPRTRQALEELGVINVGDVLQRPLAFWTGRFGKWGRALFDRARGLDNSPVTARHEPKSSSAENTFEADTRDRALLRKWLLEQSDRVGRDLRAHGWKGRTVTLKLKYADFSGVTRSRTLDAPTAATRTIFETACRLLDNVRMDKDVRLVGVGVSNFEARERWLPLLPEDDPEQRLDDALDAIADRFGPGVLTRGRLMGFGRNRKPGGGP